MREDEDVEVAELAATLRVAIGLLVRRLRQVPGAGELTWPESSALARLERGGPTTSSGLARQEQISPQSMGVTLAALEERGLVERRPDPQDGRRVLISVAGAGQQALRSKRNARNAVLAQAMSAGFTPEELRQLCTAAPLIERLAQSI